MFKITNNILTLLLLFCFFSTHAQLNSYEFKIPLPPDSPPIQGVDAPYYGSYKSTNEWLRYHVREEGIFIETITHLSIKRETIRESSTYSVRNGYLFGVTIDSVLCILEGERYHYGLKSEIPIIGENSKNILTQVTPTTYIINYYDNGSYTPSKLTFSANQLRIEHFDYDNETTVFDSISNRETRQYRIILHPSMEEWKKINGPTIFPDHHVLKK